MKTSALTAVDVDDGSAPLVWTPIGVISDAVMQ